MLLPFKPLTNDWKTFNNLKLTALSNNISTIVNKHINIYSIAHYNELFKSDL